MDSSQGADPATGHWSSRSDAFLAAAEILPAEPAFDLPRAALMARAVEYRLKAYLQASRGGAPPGNDLTHLFRLALACGLPRETGQQELLAVLAGSDPSPVPSVDSVRAFCRSVDAAAGRC